MKSFSKTNAAAPATCGEAIEVPSMVFEAEDEPIHADVIDDPGAKISTHEPILE